MGGAPAPARRLRRGNLQRAQAPGRDLLLLAAEDDGQEHADDRRLEQHDQGAAHVPHLDLEVAREEEPELPAGGRPRRRQAPLPLAAADLAAAGVHLAVDRVLRVLVLPAPLDGGELARVAALGVGVLRRHGLVDGPLSLAQHLEHVARVVDVVRLPLPLLPRPEESITVPGRAEEHGDAAVAHHQAVGELLELVLGGLVDGHDDRLARLLGEIGEQGDQRRGVVGGEAAGGLVEEEDDRIGDQLQGDVDALPLPAGEDLLLGAADLEVLHSLQAEVLDGLLDAGVDLLVAVVGREAEPGAVLDGLEDRQLRVHQVVLGDVSDGSAEVVVDVVEVLPVDADDAVGGGEIAVERQEQRGLARARGAHQGDHVAGEGLERDVVEEDLHLRGVVAVGHLEEQAPGLDLVEGAAGPAVGGVLLLDDLRGAARALLDLERHRADVDLLPVLDGDPLPGGDAVPAHERAVGAAPILDEELPVPAVQERVPARHLGVRDDDVVVRRAPDALDLLRGVGEIELPEDGLVLLARRSRARARRGNARPRHRVGGRHGDRRRPRRRRRDRPRPAPAGRRRAGRGSRPWRGSDIGPVPARLGGGRRRGAAAAFAATDPAIGDIMMALDPSCGRGICASFTRSWTCTGTGPNARMAPRSMGVGVPAGMREVPT